jgi:hypothetical protein
MYHFGGYDLISRRRLPGYKEALSTLTRDEWLFYLQDLDALMTQLTESNYKILLNNINYIMSIKLTENVLKNISSTYYYTEKRFINDAKAYLKALKSGRLKYKVKSVSKTKMSRKITVESYEGTMLKGYYRQYLAFFEALGYKTKDDTILIHGVGMDMLFATNYRICRMLENMGFISKKECDVLSQKI